MPLNRDPIRPISDQDRATYKADGVVCLRQVLDPDWISLLDEPARRIVIDKQDAGLLPHIPGRYMARTVPEFRKLIFDSAIGAAMGQLLESKEIRFFFDEIFAKEPRSTSETIWHTDRMGWPVEGKMVPSIWIPLTRVTKENSLEVVAGSHTQDVRYWLFSPNARQMIKPEDRASHPDGAKLKADPNNRFLTFDMAPGDLLVVHPWAIHYSSGNPLDDWRIALSVRVFGDDIRWQPRPDCVNLAGVSFDEMIPGEKPQGPLFPLLWSADGRRDDDSRFPRGFATSWSADQHRRDEVNEDAIFQAMRNKEAAA